MNVAVSNAHSSLDSGTNCDVAFAGSEARDKRGMGIKGKNLQVAVTRYWGIGGWISEVVRGDFFEMVLGAPRVLARVAKTGKIFLLRAKIIFDEFPNKGNASGTLASTHITRNL